MPGAQLQGHKRDLRIRRQFSLGGNRGPRSLHQQLKEEPGLDHFEGRSWAGPSPSCAHDDDRLRSSNIAVSKQQGGKKNQRAAAATDIARRARGHPRTHRSTTAQRCPHRRRWICSEKQR